GADLGDVRGPIRPNKPQIASALVCRSIDRMIARPSSKVSESCGRRHLLKDGARILLLVDKNPKDADAKRLFEVALVLLQIGIDLSLARLRYTLGDGFDQAGMEHICSNMAECRALQEAQAFGFFIHEPARNEIVLETANRIEVGGVLLTIRNRAGQGILGDEAAPHFYRR